MTQSTEAFEPKTFNIEPDEFGGTYMVARSKIDNSYIGTVEFAERLEQRGIAPQAIPGNQVASIGFCAEENKWYGWSHRAIYGFGIGSSVKKGDLSYAPKNWDDFTETMVQFWSDDGHENVQSERCYSDDGQEVVKISWTYAADKKLIPNTSLHGTTSSVICYPPEQWGRGEWTAETIEDAKQMAVDFANNVA